MTLSPSCLMSPTTPTTSRDFSGKKVKVSRFPIGFSVPQNRLAIDWLITTTCVRSAMSESVSARPRSKGTFIVSKKPGSTPRTATSGCSDIGSVGCPSAAMGCVDPSPDIGSVSIPPAEIMPGKARTRCSKASKKATCCTAVAYFVGGRAIGVVRTLCVSMPGSTR